MEPANPFALADHVLFSSFFQVSVCLNMHMLCVLGLLVNSKDVDQ